jgi:uroporphyrinogen-III decarboxylase
MLTRRKRLMATLRGQPVDRPAVNFYEIGGFKVDPEDADPYNVYNASSWRPLLQLAEQQTDVIRLMSPVRQRSIDPTDSACSAASQEFFAEKSWELDGCRMTRTTVTVAGRTMTQTTRRDRDLDTVWTTEHMLKSTDDLNAYLSIPDEAFAESIDVSSLEAEETELGDRGIVMVDSEDPLCAAAALFSMEDYTVVALTEPALFHQLLQKMARRIHRRTEQVSRLLPGRLWRIYGPEYATPPYLPPRLFDEYVVRYVGPMIRMIQAHGGFARIHSHGRLKDVLDLIAAMEPDALDPVEPPPHGDVELAYVRQRYGEQLVLFGNIEIADIESLPPDRFEEKVKRALNEGTAGSGRGFVLMPSAAPYGRTISSTTMRNYETMVRLAIGFTRPAT